MSDYCFAMHTLVMFDKTTWKIILKLKVGNRKVSLLNYKYSIKLIMSLL